MVGPLPLDRDAGRGGGDTVGVEYVSRVPRPPLDGLIDDLYYLEGAPPYARLTLPPSPAAFLIVNLGAPFRIRAGTDIEAAEYADGVVVTTPTRALEFGYPPGTRSVGMHFKPWGLAPFLSMPAAELCDRPVTLEDIWGRPTIAALRDRLATADRTAPDADAARGAADAIGPRVRRPGAGPPHEQRHRGDHGSGGDRQSERGRRRQQHASGTAVQGDHRRHAKAFARTYRLTATVLAINPAGPIDWGDLAYGAGYFDQAHFGHEFRAFTGLTPTRYVEVRRRFLREHPGHVLDGGWPLPAD